MLDGVSMDQLRCRIGVIGSLPVAPERVDAEALLEVPMLDLIRMLGHHTRVHRTSAPT
jgi:hypothetical protein